MTKRPTILNRLVAKIASQRRAALRALSACLCATALACPAQAQLMDGLHYAGEVPVGTAAMGEQIQYSDGGAGMSADQGGVYVGPGGATSMAGVPSVVEQPQTPTRTRGKLVSQAWAQGPFMQQQPVHDGGGYMPCPCDQGCDFTYYGNVEALYFRRDYDERFSLSQASLPPFDYEWAGRITIGQTKDCVNGYEFVYAGPFKWERSQLTPGPVSSVINNNGFIPAVIAPFNNATSHFQTYQARMNSIEFNRRWWAWDVFSTLIGVRVVDYREAYGLFSNSGAGVGIYEDFTRNRMVGPQIGGELMQPFGLRTLVGFKGKGALLANFSRNELFLNTAPMGKVDNDVDVAGLFEIGSYVKYSLTPSIRLTGGYELWYIPEVATVASQDLQTLNINTANKVNADDNLLIHGATMGAQILF